MRERVRIKPERNRIRPATSLTLLQACRDANLFAPWFEDPLTWRAWFAFIAALFGLPLTDKQLAIYRKHTGRTEAPSEPAKEGWLICGRRAGKSLILSIIAVYLATFRDYRPFLQPGERATIAVIASDRKQARTILRYIGALLREVPMLAAMIERETSESFDLINSVTIEVSTASSRGTRGYTFAAVLCDEIAFWPDEFSSDPDVEILNAVRPGLGTIDGSMLLCASSPHAKRGALYGAYRRHYGADGSPVLVWKAATREMNETYSQEKLDAAYEEDAASASAEYGAEFRSDIAAFIERETVEACVSTGVRERLYDAQLSYVGFVDPSGGSRDSFTLAIGHRQGEKIVLDAIRERKPPFSPDAVTREYAELLKNYRISKITGDKFAGAFSAEAFAKHGITYEQSAKPKSDLYVDMLPILNSGNVDLLDEPRLTAQLVGLERRTARSGRDSIDHPPNGHDDLANVVAGIVSNLLTTNLSYRTDLSWVGGDNEDDWRRMRLQRFINSGGYYK